jgi:3-hydroxyacyl-[acyl-carrier-protein] dehydratase
MYGLAEIMRRLPHRYPMLLVDRVAEVVPGERLTAFKAVTASEPWFRTVPLTGSDAKCPTTPFPTVLLMESLCQAAALLAVWDTAERSSKTMLLGSISDVTVHQPVEPGSVIEHRVRVSRDLGDSFLLAGESYVGGDLVLRVGQVLIALR